MKSTPGADMTVPTRSSGTFSFQAISDWTPWLTAEKLVLHGNTPLRPPTAAAILVI